MKNAALSFSLIILLTSCATIFGGARYNARVTVKNASDAKVTYNGQKISNYGSILIKRKDAYKINFLVERKGYKPESYSFRRKELRGLALGGSFVSGISVNQQTYNGTTRTTYGFIPFVLIDLINFSSLWKPSTNESGVSKENYNNYRYKLNFHNSPVNISKKEIETIVVEKSEEQEDDFLTQTEKLRDLKKMHDDGILTETEFIHMKQKIIGMPETEPETNIEEVKTENTKSNIVVITKENKLEESKINNDSELESKEVQSDKEKLKDLDKMLEFGIITDKEYQEMKEKLITQ